MILIFSYSKDLSTQKVIEWLAFKKCAYILINEFSSIKNLNINISNDSENIDFEIRNIKINFNNITTVWFRREKIYFSSNYDRANYAPEFIRQFDSFIETENDKLKEYFFLKLFEKCLINRKEDVEINKLEVLNIAASIGIKIPNTYVKTRFDSVLNKEKLITKPISECINFYFQSYMCQILTQEANSIMESKSSFPTLFQINIEKLFEIRSFYLRGEFYSIALFSQQTEGTKIDYRNYDFANSWRSVPFQLPTKLENKCKKLMKILRLESGSFDFIYDRKGEILFLEINPVGQFDNVSVIGNYFIEHKIANILTNEIYK